MEQINQLFSKLRNENNKTVFVSQDGPPSPKRGGGSSPPNPPPPPLATALVCIRINTKKKVL